MPTVYCVYSIQFLSCLRKIHKVGAARATDLCINTRGQKSLDYVWASGCLCTNTITGGLAMK